MSDKETASGGEDPSDAEQVAAAAKRSDRKKEKGLILAAKKDKKEKKEKETRYAHLGEEHSSDEENDDGRSPVKTKRSKPFMFGSVKKDKEKKKEKDHPKETKDKDKKEKPKLKLIKSYKHNSEQDLDPKAKASDECPVFGVPLEVACERHRSHDGIPLPVIVRMCIDHIEEVGLMQEGIYRSSGVKSKVTKLKNAFNSRPSLAATAVNLHDYEPAVVASVLKQFLRELPEPVLTHTLLPKFEAVSTNPTPQKRIEGMKKLMQELPECNRYLVQWIFVHMMHVVERDRFNKMTLQNVSIVLSPTMKISHKVLNVFFETSHILFDGIHIKKYVPPIVSEGGSQAAIQLPDTPEAIEEEIRKQDSLLADLHLQISSGTATKKTEEQIWEQQRIVTQLKRKLRVVQKSKSDGQMTINSQPRYQPIEYEEELNFDLQTPVQPTPVAEDESVFHPETDVKTPPESGSPVSSPVEEQSGKVTVTVRQKSKDESTIGSPKSQPKGDNRRDIHEPSQSHKNEAAQEQSQNLRKNSHVTVIKLGPQSNSTITNSSITSTSDPIVSKPEAEKGAQGPADDTTDSKTASHPVATAGVTFKIPKPKDKNQIPLLPPPPASNKIRVGNAHILRPTPASPPMARTLKSKSLPRGLPSDRSAIQSEQQSTVSSDDCVTDTTEDEEEPTATTEDDDEETRRRKKEKCEEAEAELLSDRLQLAYLKEKIKNEELAALKSELERRKVSELREIAELKEELASMQTLYQYRTFSLDSSESSSEDDNPATDDQGSDASAEDPASAKRKKSLDIDELASTLGNLVRENTELQATRLSLYDKVQQERTACVNLRIQIRVEQERQRIARERKKSRTYLGEFV